MTNWDLSQESKIDLTLKKSTNTIHHVNRLEQKNYIIISMDIKKH